MKDRKVRIDPKLKEDIEEVKLRRIKNGLEKDIRKLSFREMTRMLRNTPSYFKLIRELSTLPRREDIK